MVQVRADVDRVGRVNRAATLLHVLDFALLVHDEGGAAGKLSLFIQDAIRLRDVALHVAQEREFDSYFLGKRGVGRRSINTDAEDGGVVEVDLARIDTRLVSLEFLRSTTGEGQYVERQDDVFLAPVIAQLYHRSLIAAQSEIWCDVAHLEEGVRELRLLLLRLSSGQNGNPGKK